MAKLSIVKGATSIIVDVFIADSSSSTGAGLTGLAYNTSSLVGYYGRPDQGNAGGTAISLVTATRGTYTSGGFVEKDATNLPGVYELGLPTGVLATGARSAIVMLKGAANMAPCVLEIELTGVDNQDAVRAGMTALPNAAAAASGGLLINGSNTGTVVLAALTVTGTLTISDGLVVTRSTSNTSAISATGNGTGHGLIVTSGSGATGDGFKAVAASTNGNGITGVKTGTGKDLNTTTTALTIAADTWDIVLSGHLTAGTTGAALNGAGSAGDPWGTSLPGSYTAGQAGYILGNQMGLVDSGTAQAATGTTLQLRSAAAFADNELVGAFVYIQSATTGAGQMRQITGYVGSTDTATVDTWATTPTGTIKYNIFAGAPGSSTSPAPVNMVQILGTAVSSPATAGVLDVNVKNINNVAAATPGASGGLLISGSNAGTTTFAALTITGTLTVSDGIVVARSTSNATAITATGNGTGSGVKFISGSGATGNGLEVTSAATNGHGLVATATGTGNAVRAVSVSGDAIITVVSTSGHGATFAGTGTTKHGINATGGATTSHGISATGGGVGHGILATSGGGATGDGFRATAASTNGAGIAAIHSGTGTDFNATTTPLTPASVVGAVGSVTGAVGSVTGAVGSVTGNVGGSVGSVTGAVGSVTGNVGGSVATVTALAANSVNASALATDAVTEIVSGVLAGVVEGSTTVQQAMMLLLAIAGGARSGFSTSAPVIKNPAGTKNRITGSGADGAGNVTSVTLDLT